MFENLSDLEFDLIRSLSKWLKVRFDSAIMDSSYMVSY